MRLDRILPTLALVASTSAVQSEPIPVEPIRPDVVTFLGKYCYECHEPGVEKGDFSLAFLKPTQTPEDAAYWQLVLDNLQLGDMPPVDYEKQPPMEELEPVTAWIQAELRRAQRTLEGHASEVVLRRLNREEYENTIEDLFGVRGDFAVGFPEDTRAEGFDNIGAALMLSAEQINQYMKASEFVLNRAIQEGDRPETEKRPFTLREIQEENDRKLRERAARQKKEADLATEREKEKQKKHKSPYFPQYGEDDLLPSQHNGTNSGEVFSVNEPGFYRFRITSYPVRMEEDMMRLQISVSDGKPDTPHEIVDTIQLTEEGEPITREYVHYLQPRDRFFVKMLDGPGYLNGFAIDEQNTPAIAIREMMIEGPLIDQWPPKGHQLLLGELKPDELEDAAVPGLIKQLAPKLFRRPVEPEVVRQFASFYQQMRNAHSPIDAYRRTVTAMMTSPYFIYHLEPQEQLDGYAVANRLAYFLWRSTPDDQLLDLAAADRLSDPAVLQQQVERMLDDPRFDRFIDDFVGQWLSVERVGEMLPDQNLYPEYDRELELAMAEETRLFIAQLIKENLSMDNLIDSDWAMLNSRLAKHYDIDGVKGTEFRKVALDKADTIRGGIMTHASILMVTSNGTTTSPIIRGTWLLDHLLGTPAPEPPPDVPVIEPDIRGATTIQEQLAAHRDIPQCASCHAKIDPYGLALENFDVIGGWREKYRALEPSGNPNRPKLVDGQPITSSGVLPQQGEFQDFRQFRELLLQNRELVHRNVASKLTTFALGRALDFADQDEIDEMVRLTASNGGGMRTMIHAVVQSPLFQKP